MPHPASAFLHRKRGPRTKIQPPAQPTAIIQDYFADLKPMVAFARQLVRKNLIPRLVDLGAAEKQDHVDAGPADEPRTIKQIVHAMSQAWHKNFTGPKITKAASAAAAATNRHAEAQVFQQVKQGLGITLEHVADKRMMGMIAKFTTDNVALIRTVPEEYFGQIEQTVLDGVSKGRRAADLADDIEERGDVAANRVRLIASDQIRKFNADLTETRHRELGIEKYVWTRTPGAAKVPREEHIEREGNVYSYDDPPGDEDDPAEGGNPAVAINCFLGSMPVRLFDASIGKAYRRPYLGDLTELVSDDGRAFPSTPNHPLLTPRGWVAPHLIEVGEHVLQASCQITEPLVENAQSTDPTIEQIFGALALLRRAEVAKALSGGWFHGDAAIDEEVDVVHVNWRLLVEPYAGLSHRFCEQLLARASDAGACERPLDNSVDWLLRSPQRNMRCGCERGAIFGGHVPPANHSSLGAIAWLEAIADELRSDSCALDAEAFRDSLHRHSGLRQGDNLLARVLLGIWARSIQPAGSSRYPPGAESLGKVVGLHADDQSDLRDRVVAKQSFRVAEKRIRHLERAAHVYNLQTSTGWYVAQSLIVRNCTCWAEPFLDDIIAALDGDGEDA